MKNRGFGAWSAPSMIWLPTLRSRPSAWSSSMLGCEVALVALCWRAMRGKSPAAREMLWDLLASLFRSCSPSN